MGGGTEECSEHAVLFLGDRRLCVVCQKPDWRRYLLVAALFAAGLMAKPMVITLPFVLLLLDYWPLSERRSTKPRASGTSNGLPRVGFSRLLLEKVPLLFLSACQRMDHSHRATIRSAYSRGVLLRQPN